MAGVLFLHVIKYAEKGRAIHSKSSPSKPHLPLPSLRVFHFYPSLPHPIS